MAEKFFTYPGNTAGTSATVLNSGHSAIPSAQAPVYVSDGAGHLGLRYETAASTLCEVQDTFTGTTAGLSYATKVRPHAAPSAACVTLQSRNASAGIGDILYNTGRTLTLRNASSGVIGTSSAMTLDSFYILRVAFKPGASSTTGSLRAKLTTSDDATTLLNVESTTTDVGTAALTTLTEGKITSSPTASIDFFNSHLLTDFYGWIDPAPDAAPDGGPDQSAVPFQTVTLTGNGVGGAIWSQDASDISAGHGITLGGSGDVRTFVAPASSDGVTLNFHYGTDAVQVVVSPWDYWRKTAGGVWEPVYISVKG